MAYASSRSSSISCADSGISVGTDVNPRYACYWIDSCRGQHEIVNCSFRHKDLRGKLGIYYSPNAMFKRFTLDRINSLPLDSNPTGCTRISLLIYKVVDNEKWLLFVTQKRKEKQQHHETDSSPQLRLTFPSSNPRKKNEMQKDVALRALEGITHEREITKDLRPRLKRFLFVDAYATYPLFITNEHADLLTASFSPNEEDISLHWFPLSTVLSQLPTWENYLTRQAEDGELAQIRHDIRAGINLTTANEEYTIWSVTATVLMCIRNHVGFDEFLQA